MSGFSLVAHRICQVGPDLLPAAMAAQSTSYMKIPSMLTYEAHTEVHKTRDHYSSTELGSRITSYFCPEGLCRGIRNKDIMSSSDS